MNRLLPLAALAVLCAGCSNQNSYFDRRGRDLADIFRVNFSGAGPGFIANIRATQLAKFGGGYAGFFRGEAEGNNLWRVGTLGRRAGVWRGDEIEYGFGPWYYERFAREPVNGNIREEGSHGWYSSEYRTIDEIGFTFHLGIFGMDFAIRPLEVFDFLVGIVTLDPMSDDEEVLDPDLQPRDLEDFEKDD